MGGTRFSTPAIDDLVGSIHGCGADWAQAVFAFRRWVQFDFHDRGQAASLLSTFNEGVLPELRSKYGTNGRNLERIGQLQSEVTRYIKALRRDECPVVSEAAVAGCQ